MAEQTLSERNAEFLAGDVERARNELTGDRELHVSYVVNEAGRIERTGKSKAVTVRVIYDNEAHVGVPRLLEIVPERPVQPGISEILDKTRGAYNERYAS